MHNFQFSRWYVDPYSATTMRILSQAVVVCTDCGETKLVVITGLGNDSPKSNADVTATPGAWTYDY